MYYYKRNFLENSIKKGFIERKKKLYLIQSYKIEAKKLIFQKEKHFNFKIKKSTG